MQAKKAALNKYNATKNVYLPDCRSHYSGLPYAIQQVCSLVTDYIGIEPEEMFLPSRKREVIDSRSIVAAALRVRYKSTYSEISRIICVKKLDHTTVINAIKNYNETLIHIPHCKIAFDSACAILETPIRHSENRRWVPSITGLHLRVKSA